MNKPPLPVLSAILDVADVDRSVAFYRDALGFLPLSDRNVEEHGIRAVYRGMAFFAFRPTEVPPNSGGVTLNLLVRSLASAKVVAEVAGVTGDELVLPWGGRGLLITDPDGYNVLLSEKEPPPQVSQKPKPPRNKPDIDTVGSAGDGFNEETEEVSNSAALELIVKHLMSDGHDK